ISILPTGIMNIDSSSVRGLPQWARHVTVATVRARYLRCQSCAPYLHFYGLFFISAHTMTTNAPVILQLVPLAGTQKSDFPPGYRVISLWEEDSLDAVIQAYGNDIQILTTSAVTPTP